ncbi:hypothetical protein TARUN_7515 [Trichoderma arundinaceum]|uniref:Uncharacterized protein n=1 Tax=Trichoderma arundinaceum TaxID=490622 RepID=A0A395NFG6_TRIAR|nr:hypothetical protein TARUN_7515 [Trichoderma arundinaceum]
MRRASPQIFASLFNRSTSKRDYRVLPNHEHQTVSTKATVLRRCSQLMSRGTVWQVLFLVVLTISLFFSALSASSQLRYGAFPADRVPASGALGQEVIEAFGTVAARDPGGERRLRVFMPADSPHINLCKSIMSAVALGYPLPTLLNWKGEFNRPEWHFAGSHIAKLESLLAVIEEMLRQDDLDGGADENDLAVLVDAYDIWFQLPPSVLIERYHQLNKEANERVLKQWRAAQKDPSSDFPISPPKQSIIVTSAKDCQPDGESGSDPHYAHWPESPMPKDLYGEDTDQVLPLLFDPARKYKKIRPRCVNSGMIMGTMGALRQVLRRCKRKIETVARSGRQLWSDQALLGEVIGDQEMWREWMRELGSTWDGAVSKYDLSTLSPEVRTIAAKALVGEQFEFGIGLDYNYTTIPATCSAEEDGCFVKLNDEDALREESLRAGVPNGSRVSGVPKELNGGSEEVNIEGSPLSNIAWGDVPLYTDFFFGVTPVGIHHNAYIDGLKPWRIQNWWNLTWFHPQLRELVSAHLQPPHSSSNVTRALLRIPSHQNGKADLVYRPPSLQQNNRKVVVFEAAKGRQPAKLVPIDWDGVCQKGSIPWYEELFGDGKGPLEINITR